MSGSSPKSISISGVETDITIGKELAAVAQKSKALASRDCFEQLEMYLHGRSHDRVCLLFGLLQTGKNTMLRQAIGRMTKEDLSRIAYIKARRTDNMAMMNRDLKKLFNAGFRYVFIDEVTLMEDFIDSAALFSDVFATMGMKIVLSGTDSLGFWLAMDEELYDRAKSIHTTFIPYREYSRLLGIDSIDEYIRYGGTLRAGELAFDDEDVNAQDASFRDDESTRRYIDTAICKNIQHSLACYESGGHFRHLYSLYEAGELTSAINRIIEDMNHRFLISVLTDDFLSHDLRLTAANLRKERDPEKRTEALDAIDTEAVTQRLMELLDIRNKEEQSIGITTAHIIEIKQYLTALELIVDCPIESADPGIEPVEHQQKMLDDMKEMFSQFYSRLTDLENNQLTLKEIPTATSEDIKKLFQVEDNTLIIGNPEENKSVVGLDDVGNIPVDSAFLLVYAADGDGQILKIRTLDSPTQIFTSGKQFMADNSKRESARWEEALDRLIEWGWVKAVGYKGEIFELTGTGYSKADWLKNNMAIDTSKEPLDELKEFED